MENINRDEAVKCLNIAARALREGDTAKATRFAEKSKRLCPLPEADAILKRCREQASSGASSRPASSAKPAASTLPPKPEKKPHTPQQADAVKRVLSAKSYYEVLSINKAATEIEIKKGYKRAAISLHPDKNTAPGADEAFKKVSNAFTCLSDKEKRAHYDQFGTETPEQYAQQRHAQSGFRRRHAGMQGEMSPEDIFRAFFGAGGMHGDPFSPFGPFGGGGAQFRYSNQPRRRRAPSPSRQSQPSLAMQLLQLLPILVLFLYSTFGSSSVDSGPSDKLYSLTRESPFIYSRHSPAGVRYYVSKDTHSLFTHTPNHHKRRKTEIDVEKEELRTLQGLCTAASHENNRLKTKLKAARPGSATEESLKRRLKEADLTSCRAVDKLINRLTELGRQI